MYEEHGAGGSVGEHGAGGRGQRGLGFSFPPGRSANCKVKRRLDSPKCLACRVSSLHTEPENHEVVVVFGNHRT